MYMLHLIIQGKGSIAQRCNVYPTVQLGERDATISLKAHANTPVFYKISFQLYNSYTFNFTLPPSGPHQQVLVLKGVLKLSFLSPWPFNPFVCKRFLGPQ